MVPKGVPLLPQIEARAPHGFILRYCPHSFRHWPPCSPAERSQRMFPVTSGSRICATLRLRLPTRRNRQVAGVRVPVELVYDRAHRQLQAAHQRVRQNFLVWFGLAPLPLLFALPLSSCSTPRTPWQPRWFRQECSLPISLAAESRTRPFCTTTHTRPVNCGNSRLRRALRADDTLRRNSTEPFSY